MPVEEIAAKVVQRFFAVRKLANDGVGFEPDKHALVVVVRLSAPTRPRSAGMEGSSDRRVQHAAPGAPRRQFEPRGRGSQFIAKLLLGPESSPGIDDHP